MHKFLVGIMTEIFGMFSRFRHCASQADVRMPITNYKRSGFSRRLCVFVKGGFHDDRQPVYWRADDLCPHGPRRVKQLGGT